MLALGAFSGYTAPMAKITCNNNGPLRIEGDFLLADAEGGTFDVAGRTVISLCRCGASENKPFCDGAHKKMNFQSVIQAHDLPPAVSPTAPKP
jgi:CDGSH-type Zn-finger protein